MRIKVGDRVAYSVQFLSSIGMSTGDMAAARGEIIKIQTYGSLRLVLVQWDKPYDLPNKINAKNLAKVGLNQQFSRC